MSNLNYTTFVDQLANFIVIPSTDANFQIMLPGCIDYVENRIYRDLDPLYAQTTDTTTLTANNREFAPPTNVGEYITVDQVNVITPSTATSSNGTRNPLMPVSPEVMDALYPSGQTVTGLPQYYAMRSLDTILLGPSPDAAYQAEVIGLQRPAALSSANSSTYLTQYVPDIYMAAALVYAFGYQRDFGAQADDPKTAQSWENQYQILMKSADAEQFRANFQGSGWTTQLPSPMAPRR